MSPSEALHLSKWVEGHLAPSEKGKVLDAMLLLIHNDPDILNTHSWREIRSLTEDPQKIPQWVIKPFRI